MVLVIYNINCDNKLTSREWSQREKGIQDKIGTLNEFFGRKTRLIHPITLRNLAQMTGSFDGSMEPTILQESIGGNAGSRTGYLCAGANFMYCPISGEIKWFGNESPFEENHDFQNGIYRIALNNQRGKLFRIVDLHMDSNHDYAKSRLLLSANEYNKNFGFNFQKDG